MNDSGTDREPFRPSRAPADQGTREQGARDQGTDRFAPSEGNHQPSTTAVPSSYVPRGTLACCDRTLGSDWSRGVGLFSPGGLVGYRARSGGPIRASRVDAVRDEHFTLSPSCAVAAGVRR